MIVKLTNYLRSKLFVLMCFEDINLLSDLSSR